MPLIGNEARAERAYRALLVYQQYEDGGEDVETAAVDLIADILHMLDLQYGTTPDAALRMASAHFKAERAEVAS